jgi:hypothetical protein
MEHLWTDYFLIGEWRVCSDKICFGLTGGKIYYYPPSPTRKKTSHEIHLLIVQKPMILLNMFVTDVVVQA